MHTRTTSQRRALTSLTRVTTVVALTAMIVVTGVGVAAPAHAHVLIASSTTAAGEQAALTVTVPHGCEGSPTSSVTIKIPDEITSVTATGTEAWTVQTQTQPISPVGASGNGNGDDGGGDGGGDEAMAERVDTVTYRAVASLLDDEQGVFELGLQLPDAEGITLAFPTVQTCEQGEAAWIEVPAAGQPTEELIKPAPTLTSTAATSTPTSGPAADVPYDPTEASTTAPPENELTDDVRSGGTDEGAAAPAEPAAAGFDSARPPGAAGSAGLLGVSPRGVALLGFVLVGVVVAGAAVVRARRQS